MINAAEAHLSCDVCASEWSVQIADLARSVPIADQAADVIGSGLDDQVGVNLPDGRHLCPDCGAHWREWMERKASGKFVREGRIFEQWREERLVEVETETVRRFVKQSRQMGLC